MRVLRHENLKGRIINPKVLHYRVRMNSLPMSRIVLIDDEPGVLRALTLVLQTMGYQVMAFAAPQEALTYLKAGIEANLVLSDQRMPAMSGCELFKSLRQAGVPTPFILMSGHAQELEVQELLEQRDTAFLPKPFTPMTLQNAIHTALRDPRRAAAQ